jgi:hypothetical protein
MCPVRQVEEPPSREKAEIPINLYRWWDWLPVVKANQSSYRNCHGSNLYASDILLVSSVDRCDSPRAGRFDPNKLLRPPLAFPVCMPLRMYPSNVSKFIHAYQIVMVKNVRGTDMAKKSQAFWVYSRVMPPDASSFCFTNWVEKKFYSVRILGI